MSDSRLKPAPTRVDREWLRVAAAASTVSLLSSLYYFQRGQVLLYGDAVAHINIARRVFDSHTPGLLQLGTVWLPLSHLLMIPFLLSDKMWQSGVGGSIPSMIAFVLGVVGIFRLTRGVLEADVRTNPGARAGAWIAALVYGANPNLIYLQATAMTESLYLAFFVWALVYLLEFLQDRKGRETPLTTKDTKVHEGRHSPLWKCALCLAAAELTRYDGWFLAAAIGAVFFWMALRRWHDRAFRWLALKFLAGIAAAPLLWLAYNAAVFGNPLEFANGPFSAKAIQQRALAAGAPPHPAANHISSAASYFLKSAEFNMVAGNWGRIWVAVALGGLFLVPLRIRERGPLLLLGIPLLFYPLSIAYGGVPLYLPAWWPFTWYNVRYGLQLLPVFAVSAALIVSALIVSNPRAKPSPEATVEEERDPAPLKESPDTRLQFLLACAVVMAIGLGYFSVWKAQPLCFTEAWVNSRGKIALESAVAQTVSRLPRQSEYLMYLGDHVGVFQQAGVPLRQVINEGNHRTWKRPSDPVGLWERALVKPPNYVDYVIAFDGDPVERTADTSRLVLLTEIHAAGQPRARIYAARAATNQSR